MLSLSGLLCCRRLGIVRGPCVTGLVRTVRGGFWLTSTCLLLVFTLTLTCCRPVHGNGWGGLMYLESGFCPGCLVCESWGCLVFTFCSWFRHHCQLPAGFQVKQTFSSLVVFLHSSTSRLRGLPMSSHTSERHRAYPGSYLHSYLESVRLEVVLGEDVLLAT